MWSEWTFWGALGCAAAVELGLGEPRAALHPVVWMGRAVSALETRLFAGGPARQLVTGAAIASGVPSAFAVGAALLERSLAAVPVLAAIASGVLLSTTFSVRALGSAARDVVQHLPADLERARFNLRALCSRDASELGAPELVAATVESLAENTSDSIVAPLFYFALFGVPGAVFYRAVNTLDAMIGYHGRYEYFGKVAARLDDALNFVPARLTALLLIAAGAVRGLSARGGWLVARRDHRRTESPNAGWPMAAMAGLLGVQLEKRGAYRLGDATLPLDTPVVARAWQVVTLTTALAFALTALTATWRAAW